ncbi:MAG: M48 family metallopeptidase [bacterium]|nr:M48 family metallopeptidase [Candidatus Sumerlaeota bacterium]
MWEQIRANRRRSLTLIIVLGVVLVLMGFSIGELMFGQGGGTIGIGVALVIWLIQMMVYFLSAESVLMSGMNARELSRDESPRLFNVIEEMKIASGLNHMPRVYLVDSSAPNAFAIGRKAKDSAIAVTTGLMYRLNRDELQGVIAHETGHIKNRDVQFMTLAGVTLGTIIILSELTGRYFLFGGRMRDRSSSRSSGDGGGSQAQIVILIISLVVVVLAPILAQMLYFACSRKREYLADASSAQYTRYPEGLASALEKIAGKGSAMTVSKAVAPMFIVNPMYAASGEPSSIFSTHPPTGQRVKVLRAMAGASLADYDAAYRAAEGRGLIGTQSLNASQPEVIRASSDNAPFETRAGARSAVASSDGYTAMQCDCGAKIGVPPAYNQPQINCVRCGADIPVPAPAARNATMPGKQDA